MAQSLRINNWASTNLIEPTRLDADALTPTATLVVQDNENLNIGDYFVVGTLGAETSELLVIQSLSAATGVTTTTQTTLPHNRYDLATSIFGNKLRIYRAPDTNGLQPADSEFVVIDTVEIDIDQQYTLYTDSVGDSTYWYKFTYFNSTTTGETNVSDSKASRGGGSGNYCSIDDIRSEAGFQHASYVTDALIDRKRKAAQTEIDGALQGFYTVPFQLPINPWIADITVRLAAGLLLIDQYGQISALNTANGQTKVDGARADLLAIQLQQKVLTDTNGQSMAGPGSTGSVTSWPDTTTDATGNGSIAVQSFAEGQDMGHAFKRSDVYGYTSRKY